MANNDVQFGAGCYVLSASLSSLSFLRNSSSVRVGRFECLSSITGGVGSPNPSSRLRHLHSSQHVVHLVTLRPVGSGLNGLPHRLQTAIDSLMPMPVGAGGEIERLLVRRGIAQSLYQPRLNQYFHLIRCNVLEVEYIVLNIEWPATVIPE
jgi:hypothetical protein